MKSLISGTLILLALYAQACCAQDGSQLVMLNSQQQFFNKQIVTIQPTLLIAMSQPNYSFILYSRTNHHQGNNLKGIQQNFTNESTGLGIHQQVNNWVSTQLVVKTQQYQHKSSQLESSLSLAIQF